LLAAGGIPDHIHLLLRLAADRSISDVVRDIKSNSAAWLHDRKVLPFAWQDGYGAFSLSPSAIPGVTAYIDNQVEHHANEAFREEFLKLLIEHEVEHDPNRLWE
jgi:putative transposase